jgi:hypothetical protein
MTRKVTALYCEWVDTETSEEHIASIFGVEVMKWQSIDNYTHKTSHFPCLAQSDPADDARFSSDVFVPPTALQRCVVTRQAYRKSRRSKVESR